MCLYSITSKPHRATHDIECYKQYYVEENYLIAPCTRKVYKYKANRMIYGKFNAWRDKIWWFFHKSIKRDYLDNCEITDGFIHVFNNAPIKSWLNSAGAHTYKCVIPKNTLYYMNNGVPTMAARKIKIIEKIS